MHKRAMEEYGKESKCSETPMMALNHVSRLCRSVKDSIDFYVNVLGFVLIDRPPAFDFDGAWLFNYGIGIHLVFPMSFQCEDMAAVERKLKQLSIRHIKRTVGAADDDDDDGGDDSSGGSAIDQLFFNDPDGYMIEMCNCENLKLVPAGSAGQIKLPFDRHNPPIKTNGRLESWDR